MLGVKKAGSSWKHQLMFICPVLTIKRCDIRTMLRTFVIQSLHAAIYDHVQANSGHCSGKK